jgi:guanylate kinase
VKLFVVTGPSGAGKGTLIRALIERRGDLEVAISATTRPQRPGEEDGHDYYFLTEEEFLARIEAGDFLEHVVYVSGQRYGTLRSEVARIHATGRSVVLELETKGARAVRDAEPSAVTIFIAPPSFAELERRLRERATESSGEIDERLELAREQMQEADDFDYVVMNDDVERAVRELDGIVTREAADVGRLSAT